MHCRKAAADSCETRAPEGQNSLSGLTGQLVRAVSPGVIAAAAAAMEREIKQVSYLHSVNITPF